MNRTEQWDDLTLNAYIDGELDSETQNTILDAVDHDSELRERICKLRHTGDWMKSGYGDAMPTKRELPKRTLQWPRINSGLAATFIALVIGAAGGGVLGYWCTEKNTVAAATQTDPNKIVLHISDADPGHFEQLLNYAETFLAEHRDRGVRVEVVANAAGLDLLRVDGSAFTARVATLQKTFPNLQFIACMNALRNLRKQGIEPVLIDDVHSSTTAVDHIVKRLREGWSYRKIGDMSQI